MSNANDFRGATDSDTLEKAVENRTADGIVLIPPRESDIEQERTMAVPHDRSPHLSVSRVPAAASLTRRFTSSSSAASCFST